jgi:secreted PhoX family phosphatase
VERQFRSLSGTIRNCAGGITPWGSWLTCEEDVSKPGPRINKEHGWVFEVPASATGPVDPVPLKAMGRFNHEAACVDPATGVVYETEDREDSLLYRFIPNEPGNLAAGGKLQALAIDGMPDTRNWDAPAVAPQSWQAVRWIDLDDVESPDDDLRKRGAAAGATLFARGEGIWMGDGELYFCCTSGGAAKLGQIFRLRPQRGAPDRLQLFFESTSPDQFNYGDNLVVAPNGHLVVCEDQYTDIVTNHLRGITPDGTAYPLALARVQTEWAGACFSPDGRTLFVNLYSPTKTVAITGPWIA